MPKKDKKIKGEYSYAIKVLRKALAAFDERTETRAKLKGRTIKTLQKETKQRLSLTNAISTLDLNSLPYTTETLDKLFNDEEAKKAAEPDQR